MDLWQIIWIVCGILNLVGFVFCIIAFILEWKEEKKKQWHVLLIGIFALPLLVFVGLYIIIDYLIEVYNDRGFINHYKKKKEEKRKEIEIKAEIAENEAKRKVLKEEWERIKTSYLSGDISRTELPRVEDGEMCFEFNPEMGLSVDYDSNVREIVYVESEYNDRLNSFFQEHKSLRLYHMYKFVYLPTLCEELVKGNIIDYLYPDKAPDSKPQLELTSDYPMQFLAYPEDKAKIKQGMFFFRGGRYNHGAEYIEGDYHPLYEGSDEEIIAQLDDIIKNVHNKHSHAALYSKAERPQTKEGSTKDYADEQFSWEVVDDETAIIIEEVRERIKQLKEKGLTENFLRNLFQEKPKLSRLVVTKDMRIVLPDYQNMEIEMEPINKAVYLLFLRHPEGIIFKYLPDYRRELAEIYQKIKPFGLNERAIRSIEDVTNPCLNSINEKCARIRGAFISRFDESLAKNYYIFGWRGEAKKISLPSDLIVWEE